MSDRLLDNDSDGRRDLRASQTGVADDWLLYKSAAGVWYAAAIAEEHLQVFALQARQPWAAACDVALAPAGLRESTDSNVRTALQAIDELKTSGYQFLAGAGDCGSSRTNGRWRNYIAEALELALYRPWQLAHATTRDGGGGYGDYPALLPELENWALTGLAERAVFERYTTQLGSSIDVLQRFYRQQFGWDERVAARLAYEALTSALSRGIGFSAYYKPFTSPAERQLRVAIFQRQSLDQLRSIDADKSAMTAVLDIAIESPVVLRYLLERGANPNSANAFGKTPLMYAAQYDAAAAVQLLLQFGADPNAATVYPDDHCYYTLETRGMTPLHYAVRYASATVVELLLDSGALAFNRADGRNAGYPLDWLQRYTVTGAAEPNSSITTTEALERI